MAIELSVAAKTIINKFFLDNGGLKTAEYAKFVTAISLADSSVEAINAAVASGRFEVIILNEDPKAAATMGGGALSISIGYINNPNISHAELMATVRHEIMHTADKGMIDAAHNKFTQAVRERLALGPGQDYTDLVHAYNQEKSIIEARAEIAAWNSVVEYLTNKNNGTPPTFEQIADESPSAKRYFERMWDPILKSEVLVPRDGVILGADFKMDIDLPTATAGVARHFFFEDGKGKGFYPLGGVATLLNIVKTAGDDTVTLHTGDFGLEKDMPFAERMKVLAERLQYGFRNELDGNYSFYDSDSLSFINCRKETGTFECKSTNNGTSVSVKTDGVTTIVKQYANGSEVPDVVTTAKTIGTGVTQTAIDTNADGNPDTNTLTVGNNQYDLHNAWQLSNAEAALHNLDLSGGLYNQDFYDGFTAANTSWLLTGGPSSPTPPYNPGMGPGYDPWSGFPIGAFYEAVAPTADSAPAIAHKTPVLLGSNNLGLTAAQLAARDSNADGQLGGSELAGLNQWADLNENGHLDAGELSAATAPIHNTDYTFYTAGNGQPGAGVAATPGVSITAPMLATPYSNYRSLRDTGNHRTISMGTIEDEVWIINGVRVVTKSHYGETQWYDWTANQLKQSNDDSSLIGTDGNDYADASSFSSVSWLPSGNLVNFVAGGGDDQMGGSARSDNVWGGAGNDSLWGYAGDDALYGEEGDDLAFGGDGQDRLAGGIGNDALFGEAGNDTVVGGDGADELQGNDGNDQLSGEAGDDLMFGQVGDDQLHGGEGDDILLGFTASNEAQQTLAAGQTDNDTLIGGAGSDLLIGSFGHDVLDGGVGQDELSADDGNDQLTGGLDDDKLFGGAGDDRLWGGDGNDVLVGFTASNDAKQTLAAGETDNDALYAGAGNDLVLGGLGNDTVYGETGNDELQGGEGNDRLYGGDGADRLFGQVGDDMLYGGEGDDILVGFTASNEGKQSLSAGESDNDKLYGGAGSDLLLGGVGNDYLDGGAGADDMFGGTGDDTYIVNSVNDAIYENRNSGYDTVVSSTNYLLNQNIEELRLLEGYEIHGTGNKLNNRITGNSAGNILDGVTGADTMIGGLGDDTYYVDDVGDVIVEYANQGTETVQSSIDTTLAENLEHLILLDFSKPELGRVTGADGVSRDALVYGFPKRFELDYLQGDEVEGFEGTCALTSVANLLTQSGKPTTEGEVVRRAIDNQWAVTDPNLPSWKRGGSNAYEQLQLLTSYGLRADLLAGYNETGIANLVRSGRGVIIAVDAGVIWEFYRIRNRPG